MRTGDGFALGVTSVSFQLLCSGGFFVWRRSAATNQLNGRSQLLTSMADTSGFDSLAEEHGLLVKEISARLTELSTNAAGAVRLVLSYLRVCVWRLATCV
jgi:hypothetical protein